MVFAMKFGFTFIFTPIFFLSVFACPCDLKMGFLCLALCLQSLGMSSEFTIKEILYYFGALCKMYRWRVKERLEFFDRMFDFPKGRIKIKKLR